MRRKKGYALILTIVVISFLLVLSAIVLSLSTSAYLNTKRVEQNNKLKLAAESGIDKGNLILKNYILNHADVINNPISFTPSLLNEDVSIKDQLKYIFKNINVEIKFNPSDPTDLFNDITTGRNVAYIKITSIAKDANGKSKTVTAILDKNGINNIYFDRIFKGSFTTVCGIESGIGFDAKINKLDLSGNAFLQGAIVNLTPSTFNMDSGQIKVKAKTFTSNITIPDASKKIGLFKDDNLSNKPGWKNVKIPFLQMLNVLTKEDDKSPQYWSGADEIQNLNTGDMSNMVNYIKFQVDSASTPANPLLPTLVTYKGEKEKGKEPVDFRKLVDGDDFSGDTSGIFHEINIQLSKDYPSADENELRRLYGTFYKLVIIDGDLSITDNNKENFNNYLIYCTGKVTFEGEAHFFNSSIFANNIILEGIGKDVEFYGVATGQALEHKIGTDNLTDFSPSNKAIINNYLINNLQNYGDYIYYRILQLIE